MSRIGLIGLGAEVVVTMLPSWPQAKEVTHDPFGMIGTVKAAGTPGVPYLEFIAAHGL